MIDLSDSEDEVETGTISAKQKDPPKAPTPTDSASGQPGTPGQGGEPGGPGGDWGTPGQPSSRQGGPGGAAGVGAVQWPGLPPRAPHHRGSPRPGHRTGLGRHSPARHAPAIAR